MLLLSPTNESLNRDWNCSKYIFHQFFNEIISFQFRLKKLDALRSMIRILKEFQNVQMIKSGNIQQKIKLSCLKHFPDSVESIDLYL